MSWLTGVFKRRQFQSVVAGCGLGRRADDLGQQGGGTQVCGEAGARAELPGVHAGVGTRRPQSPGEEGTLHPLTETNKVTWELIWDRVCLGFIIK